MKILWTDLPLSVKIITSGQLFASKFMSLYAYEEEILVYAIEADTRCVYRCASCGGRVRLRRGRFRVPHFYHLSRSPSCRLYSKSEDHLLTQLSIQKMLPTGEVVLEKPFADIHRVADVAWESRKIVFEIQCSLLTPREAEHRIEDYKSVGYQLVWILDDRIFNRKILRPAEKLIRLTPSYYAALQRECPVFYDQFEIFHQQNRIKRGRALKVSIGQPRILPSFCWEEEKFPSQIVQKATVSNLYFHGDLIYRALLSESVPALAFSMQNLCALEKLLAKQARPRRSPIRRLFTKLFLEPFGFLMLLLLEQAER